MCPCKRDHVCATVSPTKARIGRIVLVLVQLVLGRYSCKSPGVLRAISLLVKTLEIASNLSDNNALKLSVCLEGGFLLLLF